MDYLRIALHNLTAKEAYLLRSRIRNQEKKMRLLEVLQQSEAIMSNEELSHAISYGGNLTNLYTLKNRLLNDLVDVKLELNRTETVRTREMIQNIRALVYSKDKSILLRQLKMLQKKCKSLELYAELREVYFCYCLLFRHDQRKLQKYQGLINDANEKQRLTDQLEELFYFRLLVTQDLYYYPNTYVFNSGLQDLQQAWMLCEKLGSKSALFLCLSGELTLYLNHFFEPDKSDEYIRKLNKLSHIYRDPVVADRYPNCSVAIQCLYSRFYYLTDQHKEFRREQKRIEKNIIQVQGHQMFDSSFYFFLYSECLERVETQSYNDLVLFIESILPADYEPSDLTTQVQFEYLLALKEYYRGNYEKSSSILLRSRMYFPFLDVYSGWAAIENILLHICNNILMGYHATIDSDMGLLKRTLSKRRVGKKVSSELRGLLKKLIKNSSIESVENSIHQITKDFSLMKLVKILPDG
ncbi:MAG TPA: hypothetical protein DCG19_00400 [Cryomorphaceae bacterium]|nr:hypothetical protein [Owenweeksia sp.]MBF97709.1 hypothetical protein [Owenweeksia sp.]HAD95828.1 hypothetical protein [Cryomorphaceae bacterium]HBF20818.1 hypothetical protein [Cryomorphaceae bacterium]|tara:strand:- start:1171 stop:2574 length:1404 start_codon:yes stop_codon:yes gene_type:complete